jgi:prevent-host-death family protein
MKTVSIREAKNRLTELAREVERGTSLTVTRNGKPVFDIVPHKLHGGVDFEAIRKHQLKHGIVNPIPYIAPDFDDPLPEDFLLRALPE